MNSGYDYVDPILELGAHVARTGIAFYDHDMHFPEEFKNNLFIALHGSWNRSEKVGYKVLRVILDERGEVIAAEDFITGWLQGQNVLGHGTDYRSVIPTSLYGPGDNYHSENSHVIPALIRKIHDAKIHQLPEVVVWGSGRPRREFVYIDDMSAAIIHVMNLDLAQYREHTEDMVSHINIGFGDDVAIKELAKKLVKIVGYKGKLSFDLNKPDGVLRKLMDSSLIELLGWKASVSLEDGLALTYADYLKNKSLLRSD